MQRCENLVDLEKRCKMSIWTQKSALIQLRTSLLKFDDLAEKSEKSSVSNFNLGKCTRRAGTSRNVRSKKKGRMCSAEKQAMRRGELFEQRVRRFKDSTTRKRRESSIEKRKMEAEETKLR